MKTKETLIYKYIYELVSQVTTCPNVALINIGRIHDHKTTFVRKHFAAKFVGLLFLNS